ncbi:MAG: hypothetical protein AAGI17_06110 [Planctomycetota bacterium]
MLGRRVRVVVLGGVFAVLGGVVAWRFWPAGDPYGAGGSYTPEEYLIEPAGGSPEVSELSMAAAGEVRATTELVRLDAAESLAAAIAGREGFPPAEELAELLAARVAGSLEIGLARDVSAGAYLSWMAQRGRPIHTRETWDDAPWSWGPPEALALWAIGEEIEEGTLSVREIFELIWERQRAGAARKDGTRITFPVLWTSDRRAVDVKSLVGTPNHPHDGYEPLDGGFAPAFWEVNQIGAMAPWFRFARHINDLYLSEGAVLQSRVGLVCELENGTRWPLVLHFFWDPIDGAWRIANMSFPQSDTGDVWFPTF